MIRKSGVEIREWFTCGIIAVILVSVFLTAGTSPVEAAMKSPPPEKIKAIIIGDRVVDIAYHLGVVPAAMSVRGSMWPMSKQIKTSSQILGCPNCVIKNENIVPDAIKQFGIKTIIIEKSTPYCIYKPQVKPEKVADLLTGLNVKIEYVDFSQGIESAIRQTAKLVNREAKASALIKKYNKALTGARKNLPLEKSGRTVVIFSGTYQPSTGKAMLRVEAPGGYSDRFLLEPLGYTNIGDSFRRGKAKPAKGHYPVKKTRKGMVLDPLLKANPDVIIVTGDAFAVQKALADYGKSHPQLSEVKAIKNMAVFALPLYVDSGVIEYPAVLKKWKVALSR